MPKFPLIYHGNPDIQGPEGGTKHMEAWRVRNSDIGTAQIDPGLPVDLSKTISPDGVEDHRVVNPASGMTVLQAGASDDVIALAKGCSHHRGTSNIEIAEAIELDM